jgi:hypothetical protein
MHMIAGETDGWTRASITLDGVRLFDCVVELFNT